MSLVKAPLSVTAMVVLLGTSALTRDAVTVPPASVWHRDLKAIVTDIITTHPDPFAKIGRTTFLRNAQTIDARLESMTDEQRLDACMRLVASLGDGHTYLYPEHARFAQFYPVRFFPFADGLFVVSAHDSAPNLAGAKVTRIGARAVDEVLAEVRALGSADNDRMSRYQIAALHNAAAMRGLGLANAEGLLPLTVETAAGQTQDILLQPRRSDSLLYGADSSTFDWIWSHELLPTPTGSMADWVAAYKGKRLTEFRAADAERPVHLSGLRVNSGQAIPGQDAYYIQLLIVNDTAAEDLEGFWKRVMHEVDLQKPRRLIIDLRRNPGGDGSRVPALVAELVRRQAAPPWKELYVLTSGRTFSASIILLDALMSFTHASYVGEPAGAAMNSFGDNESFDFPETGLQLHVSAVRHALAPADDLNAYTRIDYPADFTFADWSTGKDPALDAILAGRAQSIAAIASERGGAAAVRAYDARQSAFGTLPWFTPPPEMELIRAGQSLQSANRLEDALAVFQLEARIRPNAWRSWENLGNAQLAAGDKADAMESFRKAIEADPGNFEVPRMKSVMSAAGLPNRVLMLTGLDAPVAAIHDPDQDVYFVSNINGEGTAKDNNGYILRVFPDGRVDQARFIEGGHNGVTLNAPKGLAVLGEELWVADIDVLRAFDRKTGQPTREAKLPSPGGLFLNGLAAGPDDALYVTDTRLDFSRGARHDGPDRIFRLGRNGVVTVAFEGDLEAPSGITWDASARQFLIASLQGKHIHAWKPGAKTAPSVWAGVGGYDGIVIDGARWLVSSLDESGVCEIADGKETKIIAGLTTPATIGFDAQRRRLLIPSFDANTFQMWTVK